MVQGPMASPSRPSVRLTALATAHDHDHCKRDIQAAEIEVDVFEERDGDDAVESWHMHEDAGDTCSGNEFDEEPHFPRQAQHVALYRLEIVVDKAQDCVGDEDEYAQPHIDAGEINPEQCDQSYGEDDEDSPHGGGAGFFHVCLRGIAVYPLLEFELRKFSDEPRAEDKNR